MKIRRYNGIMEVYKDCMKKVIKMKVEKIALLLSFIMLIIGAINKEVIPYGIFLSAVSIFFVLFGYSLATSQRIQNFALKFTKNEKEVKSTQRLFGIAVGCGAIQPVIALLIMNWIVITRFF